MILDVCAAGCSYVELVAAIAESAPGDTIALGPGDWGGDLTVPHDLTIDGVAGPVRTRLAVGVSRAIEVPLGVRLTLSGLSIDTSGGVGVLVDHGALNGTNLRFTGGGVAIEATASEVIVSDSRFDASAIQQLAGVSSFERVVSDGGDFLVSDGDLVLREVWLWDAPVGASLSEVTVEDAFLAGVGPLVYASGGSVALRQCGVRGASGASTVVLLGVPDASIEGCAFAPADGASRGGAVDSTTSALVVSDSTFGGGRASSGGGLFVEGGSLAVVGSAFRDGSANAGGAIAAEGAVVSVADTLFLRGSAVDGAAIAANGGTLLVKRGWFCGGVATGAGGAIAGTDGAALTVHGSAFLANRASDGGAVFGRGEVEGSTFVGDAAEVGGAVHLLSGSVGTSVFAATPAGAALVANNAVGLATSAFFDNLPTHFTGGVAGAGLLVDVDPGLVAGTGSCDDLSVELAANSAVLAAGLGATFGADGLASAVLDVDGDGVIAALDCDDADPLARPGATERCDAADRDEDCDGFADDDDADAIGRVPRFADADGDGHGDSAAVTSDGCDALPGEVLIADDCDDTDLRVGPGRAEVPYDGVDQDCDGGDDTDLDGDGSHAAVVGGRDCDDARADVHPGADEILDDGVDQDCDGSDASPVPPRTLAVWFSGGGCSTVPGPWGHVVAFVGLVIVSRRRQDS